MKVKISPSQARGKVKAPPSKSMAHRALICAALGDRSRVFNIGKSKDVEVTLDCLEKMGAKVERIEGGVVIGGLDPFNIPENTELYCHESGSTLRFIIPLCMLSKAPVKIKGVPRLLARPLSVYEEISQKLGIEFHKTENSVVVGSGLVSGDFEVSGEVSSQFITGLLIALSCLDEKSTLKVTGKFESESYVNLTLEVLSHFGIKIERQDRVFYINPTPFCSAEYTVEADYSSTAFLEAFNYIFGEVEIEGLSDNSLQGDAVYREFYPRLAKGYDTFDLSDCPDLAPILFALSALLHGGEFTGTARLKIKESDRALAMKEELSKVGAEIEVFENKVIVKKTELHPPTTPIYSHNDHRIAMAMSVLLSVVGGEVEGAECVSKSFPDFYEKLEQLGVITEYYA